MNAPTPWCIPSLAASGSRETDVEEPMCHDTLLAWVRPPVLVALVLDAVSTLAPELLAETPASSGWRPQVLVSLLAYAYGTGCYSAERVNRLAREDPMARYLCVQAVPGPGVLAGYHRAQRALIKTVLVQVIEMAWRFCLWGRPIGQTRTGEWEELAMVEWPVWREGELHVSGIAERWLAAADGGAGVLSPDRHALVAIPTEGRNGGTLPEASCNADGRCG